MRLSEYFKRAEFECKCGCGFNTVDAELLTVLDMMRWELKAPIVITSGCRCPAYNKKIGGAEKSRHMLGQAADIVVKGFAAADVQAYLEAVYFNQYGIGKGKTFTHIDVRESPARWEY